MKAKPPGKAALALLVLVAIIGVPLGAAADVVIYPTAPEIIPVQVGISTSGYLNASYIDFIGGSYNITIINNVTGITVWSTSGGPILSNPQTIETDWTPLTTDLGIIHIITATGSKLDGRRTKTVIATAPINPIPELNTIFLVSAGIIGLFGLVGLSRRKKFL